MDFKKSVDHALGLLRNTPLRSELYESLSAAEIAVINPALATRKFPPLPEDYLYFLSQTNGCNGPSFYLYGIDQIDTASSTIGGALVEEAEDYNRDEPEDDVEDKGLLLGHMSARMMLVYQFEKYLVLDLDSRLPLDADYNDIGDFIRACVTDAEKTAQEKNGHRK